MKGDFIFGADVHSNFMEYDERLSKNYRVALTDITKSISDLLF